MRLRKIPAATKVAERPAAAGAGFWLDVLSVGVGIGPSKPI